MKRKIYVWPVCIRTFHWLYAFSFSAAFILLWFENLLKYHIALGIFFFFLTLFRIFWGIIGPLYSNFRCFDLRGDHLINYVFHIFGHKDKTPGHNPGASWGAILMLIFASLTGISGVVLLGIQEGKGIFSFLNPYFYSYMEGFYNFHAFSAYALLVIVCVHILGVIFEHFYHHSGIIWSMFTGYKYALEGESVKLNFMQNVFAAFFIFFSLFLFYYTLYKDENFMTISRFQPIDYEKNYPLLYEECGDCHIVFPAYLLPKRAWNAIMDTPEDHFGDELDLEPEDSKTIREYLVKNSGENSTREAAVKILFSIKNKKDIISIVNTPYWKDTHRHIPKRVFKLKEIDSKYSCDACHPDIVKGNIDDDNIRIPGVSFQESLKMHIFPKKVKSKEYNEEVVD